MSQRTQFTGVIAALLLPRDEAGRPAWDDFDRNASFTLRVGVSGLCVNGATGEFAGATREERREAVARARRIAGSSGVVVSGIGATRWAEFLDLAHDSEEAGADALLTPAPYFFNYSPGDLAEFYRRISGELRIPALIYNLPAFTGGIETALAMELIAGSKMIAGVKDSSGELGLLEQLTAANHGRAVRLVGNDSVLAEALERGVCDGTISGVAGVVPEITLALWRSARDNGGSLFTRLRARLGALIGQLDAFPTPWGLKLIAELRGLGPASFGLPLSPERKRQAEEFQRAWPVWWSEAEADLAQALGAPVQPGSDGVQSASTELAR